MPVRIMLLKIEINAREQQEKKLKVNCEKFINT